MLPLNCSLVTRNYQDSSAKYLPAFRYAHRLRKSDVPGLIIMCGREAITKQGKDSPPLFRATGSEYKNSWVQDIL